MPDDLARPLTSMHIVVVDDQVFHRRLVNDVLRDHGYVHVTLCESGEEAVTVCRDQSADLLLLDIHMPGMDGFDVLRELADLVRGPDKLPVCLLTADGGVDRRREALLLGCRDFVAKPVDQIELALRVHNLLEIRAHQQRLLTINSGLSADVRRRTAELEASRLEMLFRLARAAEWRDDETQHHAERIGELSAMIARCLGLGVERVDLIRLAAPLHDVGKVGIPDSILLKPGPLTDEERDIMRRHAEIGGRILSGSRSEVLRTAEVIAWCHHERFDGGGYPHGLRGSGIPIEGRIVAVADVFDALTHERPYKKAWSVDDAIDLISSERGKHFAPDVVDAMLAALPLVAQLAA